MYKRQIKETQKDEVGTKIELTLKDDTDDEKFSEYLDEYRISALVKKYSDYIRYPIYMVMEKTVEASDGKGYEKVMEDTVLNSMVPLWRRNKKDITEEEYNTFYRDKFFDYNEPLHVINVKTEGLVSYNAILYIPKKPPYDFYTKEYKRGLQLYSNNVMIMENCEDLLPSYFGFVKGVVESSDLSLNISREMLQHDRQSVSYTHLDVYKRQGISDIFFTASSVETFASVMIALLLPRSRMLLASFRVSIPHRPGI